VVKSLSSYLGRTRGIAGATILGDGQVVLIVDVPTLIKRSLSREADQPAATNQDGADAPLPVAALNGDAAAELSVAAIDSETRDPDVERNGA
jgi:chemotaxis protein histidine kinase CheA